RFAKVPELLSVCWLDIYGSINGRLLSRKTAYAAYIVFKLVPDAYGLDSPYQKGSVILGSYESANHVSLQPEESSSDDEEAEEGREGRMRSREDGWLEVELGEFYNDEGDEGEVEMRLIETDELQWKHGLILQGFEVRPKK
ncbi:F-box protein, partial [Musa troglodytarum]